MDNGKILLTVREAAAYFGVGQRRIREIVRSDYNHSLHLMIGTTCKIKRDPFEKFLYKASHI